MTCTVCCPVILAYMKFVLHWLLPSGREHLQRPTAWPSRLRPRALTVEDVSGVELVVAVLIGLLHLPGGLHPPQQAVGAHLAVEVHAALCPGSQGDVAVGWDKPQNKTISTTERGLMKEMGNRSHRLVALLPIILNVLLQIRETQ